MCYSEFYWDGKQRRWRYHRYRRGWTWGPIPPLKPFPLFGERGSSLTQLSIACEAINLNSLGKGCKIPYTNWIGLLCNKSVLVFGVLTVAVVAMRRLVTWRRKVLRVIDFFNSQVTMVFTCRWESKEASINPVLVVLNQRIRKAGNKFIVQGNDYSHSLLLWIYI